LKTANPSKVRGFESHPRRLASGAAFHRGTWHDRRGQTAMPAFRPDYSRRESRVHDRGEQARRPDPAGGRDGDGSAVPEQPAVPAVSALSPVSADGCLPAALLVLVRLWTSIGRRSGPRRSRRSRRRRNRDAGRRNRRYDSRAWWRRDSAKGGRPCRPGQYRGRYSDRQHSGFAQ
jgi:hypothetical protein